MPMQAHLEAQDNADCDQMAHSTERKHVDNCKSCATPGDENRLWQCPHFSDPAVHEDGRVKTPSCLPAGSPVMRPALSVSYNCRPADARFLTVGARPKRPAARNRDVDTMKICSPASQCELSIEKLASFVQLSDVQSCRD